CQAPESYRPPAGTDVLAWCIARLAEVNEHVADLIDEAIGPAARWCRFVVRQGVAYASAGNDTEFDAAELLSAVIIAERWGSIAQLEVDDAIDKALRAIRPDGSWTAGQPIYVEKRALGVFPSMTDIVWLLVTAIRGQPKVQRGDAALMAFVEWL